MPTNPLGTPPGTKRQKPEGPRLTTPPSAILEQNQDEKAAAVA
jgi:hypothetical protein